jgi:hypothetical protein
MVENFGHLVSVKRYNYTTFKYIKYHRLYKVPLTLNVLTMMWPPVSIIQDFTKTQVFTSMFPLYGICICTVGMSNHCNNTANRFPAKIRASFNFRRCGKIPNESRSARVGHSLSSGHLSDSLRYWFFVAFLKDDVLIFFLRSLNSNAGGWGHIWLRKLWTGTTPQRLK